MTGCARRGRRRHRPFKPRRRRPRRRCGPVWKPLFLVTPRSKSAQ